VEKRFPEPSAVSPPMMYNDPFIEAVAWRIRRCGSPAQPSGRVINSGCLGFNNSAESLLSGRFPESGPVLPPKMSEKEELNAETVCQASVGPCEEEEFAEPETYCHGGTDGLNAVDRERKRRSLLQGAES
jgi:hypothetical protein